VVARTTATQKKIKVVWGKLKRGRERKTEPTRLKKKEGGDRKDKKKTLWNTEMLEAIFPGLVSGCDVSFVFQLRPNLLQCSMRIITTSSDIFDQSCRILC
jgi:hypothetical protein